MLEELSIRNLGPIRTATLTPAAGMTAITGETGAGKSMLLSAVRLVSGGAAEGSRVSADADAAWAQAIFSLDGPDAAPEEDGATAGAAALSGVPAALAAARDAGVEPEDGELILSRAVPASGRSRAVLGGRTVPRSVLAAVAGELIVIHGQADQLRIASPARQRDFLDMVAADEAERAAYAAAWGELKALDARLMRLRDQQADARQRADYLRESIARIDRADPRPGEDEELKARRDRIENAAEITDGVSRALAALDPSQVDADADAAGAAELIGRAAQALRSIHADGGGYAALADRLDTVGADLADIAFSLSGMLDADGGEGDLDAINARIHELDELALRWGPTLADVLAWRDKAAFEVEDLDASPEKLAELEERRGQLAAAARDAADRLGKARRLAAADLAAKVTDELGSLAMAGARLDIDVTARPELDAHGGDDVAFLFTPFPGSPRLAMGRSASGGELSRLMLAMELAAAERREGGMTFIFDEVDAGVGGKAAAELGRRLARLARCAQVIVVTHLAQVASWADAQFVVAKGTAGEGDAAVETRVRRVDGEERVHEIARMLSGSETGASLDHARELLDESRL
ncbi:DNA repair protein RecN [Bifidobacterium pullorum subsp. saeculare]|uniref:DNA repair protein RecN n=1 Tax=Bifidobacterium pullorum subsp. saeculare TaxID=78257 RepID=A0A939B9C8_9BIFI|nr:DNA repair protein RecN [Bifidobacterium pullorum]MBM6699095.1 DNA repair protein RecN [Bifidobacterium pullorum subsp. saeculare]